MFEYATMEWLWDGGTIKINLPNSVEENSQGSYNEVVTQLTKLGGSGWEVVACVANANWLFWTLKRTGR